MNGFRGFLVLLAASLGGFVGMMVWVFWQADAMQRGEGNVFEGLALMMAGAFWTGQAAATGLRLSAQEIDGIRQHGRFQSGLANLGAGLVVVAAYSESLNRQLSILSATLLAAGIASAVFGGWTLWKHFRRRAASGPQPGA